MAECGGSGNRRSGARSAALLHTAARPRRAKARRRFAIATVLAALALTLLAGAAHSAPHDLTLVSTSDTGAKGSGASTFAAVSADGTVVAFLSGSTNLDPGDTDTIQDVYVKNLTTGDITLASTSDAETKANANSFNPHLSADGTTVAFESFSTNLDPGDTDGVLDIYVKNLSTGDISLASTSDTAVKGNGISGDPELSGDGTKVAFTSSSTLDPLDTNALNDVYVKDVVTGDIVLASTSDSGVQGNAHSGSAALSADGTTVAFTSSASNLDAADGDFIVDVFVKNIVTGDVTLASRPAVGAKGNDASVGSSLSADGTRVAFKSRATNLHPADGDATWDVYVKDLTTGALTLASASDGGTKGNGESAGVANLAASLSADGTRVAFMSMATNLDPADSDAIEDIYVKDLDTRDIVLASTSAIGTKGDASSFNPSLSSDGAKVAFSSRASNLHPADQDPFPRSDIYLKEVGASPPPPTVADLSLFMTDSPDPVAPGADLTYTIEVFNGGPAQATSVEVSDDLPAGVTLLSVTPSSGGACDTTGDPIVCRWPALDVLDLATVDIVVTTPGAPTTLTNTASVSSTTTDPVLANNSESATTDIRDAAADLRLFMADIPDPVPAGGELRYIIDFFNIGPDLATSVEMSIDLPEGVTLVRATPSPGVCDTTGDPIVCSWSTVDVAALIAVDVVVIAPSTAGEITTEVTIAANEPDPDLASNEATISTRVVPVSVNDPPLPTDDAITVAEDGSTTFDPRANDAPGPADESPQTLTIATVSDPANGTATITPGGNVQYTPDPDHFGGDAFTYTVCDNGNPSLCDSATVNVSVSAVNDSTDAGDDSITVPESGSHTFEARTNDSPGPANEAAQMLAVQAITQAPAHGTASVVADGRIVYTPTPGFDGADGFSYRVCDDGTTAAAPDPRCDEAAVTVDIESFDEQLEEIIDTSPDPVADKVEDALEKIQKAEQKLAQTPPDRQGALGEYEGAVGEIAAAVKDGVLPGALGRSLMDRICASARKVAEDAISEAEARGGNASKVAEARRSRDEGDARRTAGRFKDAVSRYKDAVSKAEGA